MSHIDEDDDQYDPTITNIMTNGVIDSIASVSQPQSNFTFQTPSDGFYTEDLVRLTIENENYRKVLYTTNHQQLVLMSIRTGTTTGDEVHLYTDRFFRVEQGDGVLIVNGHERSIKNDSSFLIPRGSRHNIICRGSQPLKLYTIYSHPQQPLTRDTRTRLSTGQALAIFVLIIFLVSAVSK